MLNLKLTGLRIDAHVTKPGSRGGHIIGYRKGEPIYGKPEHAPEFQRDYKYPSNKSPFLNNMRRQQELDVSQYLSGGVGQLAEHSHGDVRVVTTNSGRHLTFHKDLPNHPVPSGVWMDWPEQHWGLTEAEYRRKPRQERAALETKEQATKYAGDQYEDHFLRFYHPDVWEKEGLLNADKSKTVKVFKRMTKGLK